jgi:hypothetical protein
MNRKIMSHRIPAWLKSTYSGTGISEAARIHEMLKDQTQNACSIGIKNKSASAKGSEQSRLNWEGQS